MSRIVLRIATDHPAYAGHFPGRPILPAVVLVAEALAGITAASNTTAADWSLQQAKFLRSVAPGAPLALATSATATDGMRFEIDSDGEPVANGVFTRVAHP